MTRNGPERRCSCAQRHDVSPAPRSRSRTDLLHVVETLSCATPDPFTGERPDAAASEGRDRQVRQMRSGAERT
jgi:hypothetical protein